MTFLELKKGYITNVIAIFQAAWQYYENTYVLTNYTRAKNPAYHFKFFLHTVDDNQIRRPNEPLSPLSQISKNYQLVVKESWVV